MSHFLPEKKNKLNEQKNYGILVFNWVFEGKTEHSAKNSLVSQSLVQMQKQIIITSDPKPDN